MRAAELIAPLTFRLTEMPIDDPAPGEVQVRIEAVGVCGSDLHAYSEGAVGGMPNVYPMVLGHEPSGVHRQRPAPASPVLLQAIAARLSRPSTAITASSA